MPTHTIFDKSRLPSLHATVGPGRAPHRSYYYAIGLSQASGVAVLITGAFFPSNAVGISPRFVVIPGLPGPAPEIGQPIIDAVSVGGRGRDGD